MTDKKPAGLTDDEWAIIVERRQRTESVDVAEKEYRDAVSERDAADAAFAEAKQAARKKAAAWMKAAKDAGVDIPEEARKAAGKAAASGGQRASRRQLRDVTPDEVLAIVKRDEDYVTPGVDGHPGATMPRILGAHPVRRSSVDAVLKELEKAKKVKPSGDGKFRRYLPA